MIGINFAENRDFLPALVGDKSAPGMEAATGRWVNGVTYLAQECRGLLDPTWLRLRHGGEECFCIGVRGIIEYLIRIAYLYYLSQIHHGDIGSYML